MTLNIPPFQPKHPAPQLFAGRQESPNPKAGKHIQPLTLHEDLFTRAEDIPKVEKPLITSDELELLLDDVGFYKDSYEKTSKSPSQGGIDPERLPTLRPKQTEPQSHFLAETPLNSEKKRQGLVNERIALIEDYKNGERGRTKLSQKHGVKPHTVDSWVRRFKKNPDTPFFKPTPNSQLSEIPALDLLEAGPSRKRGRENEEFAPEWAAPSPRSNSKVVDWIFNLAADPPSPKSPSPELIDQEWDSFFDWEAWENRTIPDQKTNLP